MTELQPVEPFDPTHHGVASFGCGQPALDRWLRAYAGQAQRRDVARTYVAADADQCVAGYYTLVAAQVEYDAASADVSRGVSRHFPIPICLIARLAVDDRWQRQGLGGGLLRDGLGRALAAAEHIGIRAVVVDAIDLGAAGFYRQFGFESVSVDGLSLMMPLSAVRAHWPRPN